ncbi:CZB domain-containing protein [Sulfurimonas sp.]|uniref:CZB domain-containing protein n=1 Tax=Sulfurimonas sp. TaxID=2022749 RepID=UPI0039E55A9E
MSRLADESSHHMETLGTALNTSNKMAQESSKNAMYINRIFLISVAKIDHIVIKSTAYQHVLNEDSSEPLLDHLNCRFGKWYAGEGKEEFGKTKSFKVLDKPHANLHKKINDNMIYAEESKVYDPGNTQAIIENFESMEASSEEFFTYLERMIEE